MSARRSLTRVLPCATVLRIMDQNPEPRIRRAHSGDELEVARFTEAFDGDVDLHETRRMLSDDRHVLLLAYLGLHPAGFVSCVEVLHPDKRPELFLNEIGVIEDARRRGVARALVREALRVARDWGCSSLWVLTNEENHAAVRLYASTGGRWDGRPQAMFEYDLDGPAS
jgi:ribosomal protein S18 acetylase RimI-like enzyme